MSKELGSRRIIDASKDAFRLAADGGGNIDDDAIDTSDCTLGNVGKFTVGVAAFESFFSGVGVDIE